MKNIFTEIKQFVNEWKQEIKETISWLNKTIEIGIIQVGDDAAATTYTKNKIKDCAEVGIKANVYNFSEDISYREFKDNLGRICDINSGVIIQQPLPDQINVNINEVKNMIPPEKDIDGLNEGYFLPCTPYGIISYLNYKGFVFEGANVLIIGRSDIVGKPLAKILTNKDCTVVLAHSKTKNLWDFIPKADLIICAVGQANFLDCKDILCPVVDVGINFKNGKLVGDCYNTEYRNVSPVPGGVGLLTRTAALQNCLISALYNKEEE